MPPDAPLKKPQAASEPMYAVETYGELHPFMQREWLLTNGLGTFAMGTVVGCNTRRYHALLCAAKTPPVGRVVALSRVAEILYLDGDNNRMIELAVNQFGGGNVHPRGDRYLRKFNFDGVARWEYEAEGATVVKELQVLWKQNVAGVRYTVDAGTSPDASGGGPTGRRKVKLDLLVFAALRDFHSLRHGGNFEVRVEGPRPESAGGHPAGPRVIVKEGHNELFVAADGGRFAESRDWWYGHVYPVETERGQDDTEDLFCPGRFTLEGEGKLSVTLWASIEPLAKLPDWDEQLTLRGKARQADCKPVSLYAGSQPQAEPAAGRSDTLKRLFRAADDFVVFRKAPDGSAGTSILAGYPWFADWGRDTFISLPGLMLLPGRFEQARQVLRVFGEYVSEGMVPNVFDDYSNEPHYNTVDASLWYVHSAFEYLRQSKDREGFEKWMLPPCKRIIDGYSKGTRYGIKMEADGLITQGDQDTQLTWMDAKTGGVAFTPRQGKPVEINALWYHALLLMGEKGLAGRVAESFRKAFWISPFRGLADVVDPGGRDQRIRPNQIFAVSLPNSPLTPDQQRAVVEVVRRELLTPVGLRTLSRGDPGYRGRYTGPQFDRDGAYHNGTVWPWLIGPFLAAYLRVNDRSPAAIEQGRRWLQPLIDHMARDCVGQVAEIAEGDEPHRPGGCPAQAWSVAEVLRLAVELEM